jgi:hypothetical protein
VAKRENPRGKAEGKIQDIETHLEISPYKLPGLSAQE